MLRLKGACTDWTSYIENSRPNCLIIKRFACFEGASRFGRLILDVTPIDALPTSSGLNFRSPEPKQTACRSPVPSHFGVNLVTDL
jgi:hypothetical protein